MTDTTFSRIYFKREGGGNKAFFVATDRTAQEVTFNVVKYHFRETDLTFRRSFEQEEHVGRLVSDVLDGKARIEGKQAERELPTGTWVHIYGVTPSDKFVEITDQTLVGRLMVLEDLVESHLGKS